MSLLNDLPPPEPVPATMSAMVLTGHGGFDRLSWRTDVPTPQAGPGEVLIRVGAAGLNNTDINTRVGWYSQGGAADGPIADGGWTGDALAFPRIQGADVCGRVVAVGTGVPPARLGQRVIVQSCLVSLRRDDRDVWLGSERDGGFAQFVSAPAADTYAIESALSDVELASFPCSYATAENLLTRSGVRSGERVLITGATGGLGSAAVQLAARRGAEVIAVVSADKRDACRALGAAQLVTREDDLRQVLGDNSLDVVIDGVGGPGWAGLPDLLKPRGRYAVSGAVAGPMVSLDLRKLYLKDLTFFGCTAQDPGVFAALVGHIQRGEVRPMVAAVFPLQDLVAAQDMFLARRHVGKLVVVPPG
jgi:NADPH:quinone reductase-like Zn-dependent oxidoreductase